MMDYGEVAVSQERSTFQGGGDDKRQHSLLSRLELDRIQRKSVRVATP